MFDPVRLFLHLNYYYGRLMGVINFELDMTTGRAKLTRKATFYAAVANILTFSMLPLLARIQIWHLFLKDSNAFHENVFLIVMCLRIACVCATMLSRWWQRPQIVNLLRQYRRLVLEQPQVVKLWRRGVISKFTTGVLTEVIHVLLALNGLRHNFNIRLTLLVFTMYVLIAILNVILSQYYFAMLNLHGHYVLFNEELRLILAEAQSLELDHRKGVRNLRSLALADRVDKLASLQSQLQTLIHKMAGMFGIQSICMGVIIYISFIAGTYYAFLIIKYDLRHINWLKWNNLLLLVAITNYFVDNHITFSITYYLQDRHAALRDLIVQHTSIAPDSDVRLQKAFECFQLQLIRNPLKLSVMGLYSINRSNTVVMFSSIVTHSLLLIQYDLQNF